MEINGLRARSILDSRGNPTVEVDIYLKDGSFGRAAVPSGASTGIHEALELRDGGDLFGGQGVEKAIHNISTVIFPAIKGLKADDQGGIDTLMKKLDGTENKSYLGANAMLAVSLACAHAAAKSRGILLYAYINEIFQGEKSLPMPMMNVLNGGKHAVGGVDIQETMIIPSSAPTIKDAVRMGSEIFHTLASSLKARGLSTLVGDEGGYAPGVQDYVQLLDILCEAVEKNHYQLGKDIHFALDIASSELFDEGTYTFHSEQRQFKPHDLVEWYNALSNRYPIISIEDGLDQDSWEDWAQMNSSLGQKLQLVGDDFLVTNPDRLTKAISMNAANAILIKPNQIGTLSETLETIKKAQNANWNTIISHRSGETEDTTIAHIAIGTNAGQIKTGSLSRSERLAKYNELIRLEEIDPGLKFKH